ncbi:MAG: hypothetical protein ACHQFX_04025 [Chitinophagales bacterium]
MTLIIVIMLIQRLYLLQLNESIIMLVPLFLKILSPIGWPAWQYDGNQLTC